MQQMINSHQFTDADGNPAGGTIYAPGLCIAFQNGPLGREKPNGCFVETIIAAAIIRLEHYQKSKFQCLANEFAIGSLKDALDSLGARTKDREARGVEGTHKI